MPELVIEHPTSNPNSGNIPNGNYLPHKDLFGYSSPRSPLSTHSPESDSMDLGVDSPGALDTSIEQLYHNVCEMQSSDQSPSRFSYLSYGHESRIDSELRFLAGGDFMKPAGDVTKEPGVETDEKEPNEASNDTNSVVVKPNESSGPKARTISPNTRPPLGKKMTSKTNKKHEKNPVTEDAGYLATYLLKQARDLLSTGENPKKAFELAQRALKSFEMSQSEKPNLEFVMCLHIVAALNCSLGRYTDAIPLLERSIEIPNMDEGQKHSLAKFAGCMQLGDAYAMLGNIENSTLCYTAGLEIQRQVLGETDARFGETCRYVAEAHVQAMRFDEAKRLCQMALDIHKSGSPASLEEAADRRLMGLICDSMGDYETALEHYVLASMAMSAGGHDADVAAIDVCIGDAYLALARYDEAIFSYQKALNLFKSTKGENHPSSASVFVRLADVNNKIGKFRESKSYCENALRIYVKPVPGFPKEEIASGLIEVSAIYESMKELDQALNLLKKALKVYGKAPGQSSTVAGIEAQIGVLYYMMGRYSESYNSLKAAVAKLRVIGEKKSALFGVALNQMGLACVQINSINEAADLFEEARGILETEYGPHHPDTLGVYSNLAGTYDAMGRWNDAIEILEYVVGMREEKLGTANPDVEDEKRRLAELLEDVGRNRNKKSLSLEYLLDA
ncbi:putative 43kDa postsynaptic protein [Helianthus annuus]|nr:putative tetratricopeptide-like helical domain superfamily [Helianthus annuus]KAJ0830600.1 putative 43kDa postsynaptic protein [Helianthus annuus]